MSSIPHTTIRVPEHLKIVFANYAQTKGKSLNALIIDTLSELILSDKESIPDLDVIDVDVLEQHLKEVAIKKIKFLRSRNCSELYEVPQIVKELRKMLSKSYIPEDVVNMNFDYTCKIISLSGNAKFMLIELLRATIRLNNTYGWEYGEQKVRVELRKLNVSDVELTNAGLDRTRGNQLDKPNEEEMNDEG